MDEKKTLSDAEKAEKVKAAAAAAAARKKADAGEAKKAAKPKADEADKKPAKKPEAEEKKAPKKVDKDEEEVKKPAKKADKDDDEVEKGSGSGNTKGLRAGAIILWVLAVACEVGAFFAFSWGIRNNNLTFGTPISQYPEFWLLIAALVLDAIFCIIAAQLWKKANRIKPCLSDSKFVRTVWHQLGVIMVLVCFLPIGIFLLLKADKLNKKTKTILLIVVAALFAGATALSVDYKQPTEEEVQKLQQEAAAEVGDSDVYWTRYGTKYHYYDDCQYLKNTKEENLFSGPLDDTAEDAETNDINSAFESNRWELCSACEGRADAAIADAGEATEDAAEDGDITDTIGELVEDATEELEDAA